MLGINRIRSKEYWQCYYGKSIEGELYVDHSGNYWVGTSDGSFHRIEGYSPAKGQIDGQLVQFDDIMYVVMNERLVPLKCNKTGGA